MRGGAIIGMLALVGSLAAGPAFAEPDFRIYRSADEGWAFDASKLARDDVGVVKAEYAATVNPPGTIDGKAYRLIYSQVFLNCAARTLQVHAVIYYVDPQHVATSRVMPRDEPWTPIADAGVAPPLKVLFGIACEGAAPPPNAEYARTIPSMLERVATSQRETPRL